MTPEQQDWQRRIEADLTYPDQPYQPRLIDRLVIRPYYRVLNWLRRSI